MNISMITSSIGCNQQRLVTFSSWVLIGVFTCACFGYAYVFSGFGTLYYSGLKDTIESKSKKKKVFTVKQVRFSRPSITGDRCVTGPRRESQALPPRLKLSDYAKVYDLAHHDWERTHEVGLWCLDESASFTEIENEMRAQRSARLLVGDDAPRYFWVIFISAVAVATWSFFVCAGCLKTWSVALSVKNQAARIALYSSSCFGACVLCVFLKLTVLSWALTEPPISSFTLERFHWFPWTLERTVTDCAIAPATWSVLTACLCWFAIAAMGNALKAGGRYSTESQIMSTRFSRFLLWSTPVLLMQCLGVSQILKKILTPAMLTAGMY